MLQEKPWRLSRYVNSAGNDEFSDWLNSLDRTDQRRIRVLLARLESGNVSAFKWIGRNLGELRLDTGPGYRIYVSRHGNDQLILLLGGDKKSQRRDIAKAKKYVDSL